MTLKTINTSVVNILSHKLIRSSLYSVSGMLLSGILGYLFHFIISRHIPVAEYGELQTLIAISFIAGVIGTGVLNFTIKYSSVFAKYLDYASTQRFYRSIKKRVHIIGVLSAFVIMMLSPFLAKLFKLSDVVGIVLIGVGIYFSLLSALITGVLSGWERFFEINVNGFIGAMLKLFFGLVVVYIIPKGSVVFGAITLSSIFIYIHLEYYRRRLFPEQQSFHAVNNMESYFTSYDIRKSLAPIFIYSSLMIIIGNIEILLVKYFTNAELTGHFGALNMIGKLLFAVNGSIIAVVLPMACAESHGGKKLNRNVLLSIYGAILLVSVTALYVYWAFPGQVISILFGNKYLVYSADLWRFALAGALFSLFMLEANLSYALHNFIINYIILFVTVLMGTIIYYYHDSMTILINVINGSFAVGFILAFVLNFVWSQTRPFAIKTCK